MKTENARNGSLTKVFIVVGALVLLMLVLIPAISRAKLYADLMMVGSHGKDLYTGITFVGVCHFIVRIN